MSTQTRYTYSTSLAVTSCGECQIPFAIPDNMYTARQADGRSFYCPNGHYVGFKETENQRLTRQLKAQQKAAENLNAELDRTQGSLRATKGVVTKLRKRTAEGACPFCGQHLRDLQRHVGRQHAEEAAVALAESEVTA